MLLIFYIGILAVISCQKETSHLSKTACHSASEYELSELNGHCHRLFHGSNSAKQMLKGIDLKEIPKYHFYSSLIYEKSRKF